MSPSHSGAEAPKGFEKVVGLKAANVELWGIQAVRPDDWVYLLVGVEAHGDRLDLLFDDQTQGDGPPAAPGIRLSVWSAQGIRASKSKVEIQSAAKVAWSDRLVVVNTGTGLTVSTKTQNAQQRDLPRHPAVLLR